MKLVENKTRKHKGVQYMKYVITIPNKAIEKLGWKDGEELEWDVEDGKLVIEKD